MATPWPRPRRSVTDVAEAAADDPLVDGGSKRCGMEAEMHRDVKGRGLHARGPRARVRAGWNRATEREVREGSG
jgi:hypothetical protein